MPHGLSVALTLIVMLVGLAGVVLPVLPGLALMWLGALAYGLTQGFGRAGPWLFAAITLLALAGLGVEAVLSHVGARAGGASWRAMLASTALGLVGFALFSLPGLIGGALAGMLVVEYWRRHNWREAWKAAGGMAAGCGLSFFVNIAIGLAMLGLWGLWVWIER